MSLIKSHNYTINLDNVQYFKSFGDGTIFRMIDDKAVKITCPYDVVIHQLAMGLVAPAKTIINLEY